MIFPAQTSRLVLRAWREDDFDAFAAMNADPRVMEYFPAPLTREESAAFFGHIREEFQTEGFGLYAVERISDGLLLGYTGLHRVTFDGLCGQIEVIWRLRADAWGNGYAPEAAQACLTLAAKLGIEEAIAFTAVTNRRSQRVMQKIGMECVGQFNHPTLPEGHPLRRHVLYWIGIKGIDSVNGQARSRIAAEYPGAADAGNDNPRKLDGLRGLLPFRAEAPPGGLARGKAAAAFPLHAFIPQRPVPRRPRSGDYFSTKSTVPRMSSDAAPT